jgi:AcrR family transcriptional regulator
MESTSNVEQPTRRPGGRTAEVSRRVKDAVIRLLIEGGMGACTLALVAERAGVERSTLYRRYGDRWAMMIDAILDFAADEIPSVSTGSFANDLRFLLDRTAEILATPLGPAVWTVGAALRAGSAPEHHARFWQTRFKQILPIFEAAKARGELARDADEEEILAFALGAVHYRMLVIGKRVDSPTIDRIVECACTLYCKRRRSVEMEPAVAAAEV